MTSQLRPTIDELVANGWVGPQQLAEFRAVAEIRVAGQRLGAIRPQLFSDSLHEYRYGKKDSEVRIAAHALVGAGIYAANLLPRDRPDFAVELPTGIIHAEVAEIHEPHSARYTNTVASLKIKARDYLVNEPALQKTLGDIFLSVILAQCPSKTNGRRILDDVAAFITLRTFNDVPRGNLVHVRDARFRSLIDHGAKVYVNDQRGGHLTIDTDAGWFDPLGMVPIALTVLERKKKKAFEYPIIPDILILAITDVRGSFTQSVTKLSQMEPDISPYCAVLISYEGRVITWGALPQASFHLASTLAAISGSAQRE